MTTLMAERRPGSRTRDADESREADGRQQSLFGGEAFAPPRPPTPVPWEARTRAPRVPEPEALGAASPEALAPETASAPDPETAAPEALAPPAPEATAAQALVPPAPEATAAEALVPPAPEATAAEALAPTAPEFVDAPSEGVTPDAPSAPVAGRPLARPTLDDAISRTWEGVLTGLPMGCPVCGHELRVSLGGPVHGSCGSCGASID